MSVKFIKTGAESVALAKQAQLEAEKRKEQQGKLWRFWLEEGEEGRITFVDGDLTEEGYLNPPRWWEHNLFLNNEWGNTFVCPEKTMPDLKDACPICEGGDRAALLAAFTIIDHRTYISKKDPKKSYTNTKKLLLAKPQTFEILNKLAGKRGGLAGCTFDVSRIGDKAAAVGSMFDFVEKKTIEELKKIYIRKWTDPQSNKEMVDTEYFSPANYEEEVTYHTGDELRKLGLGKKGSSGGGTVSNPGGTTAGTTDYTKQM